MILYVLRGAFILLAAAVAALYLISFQRESGDAVASSAVAFRDIALMLGITVGIAAVFIVIDVCTPRKKLSSMSGVFLGLIAGLCIAFASGKAIDLVGLLVPPPKGVDGKAYLNLLEGAKIFIGLVSCYICMSLVLQTKDDFRFVIPYVEFAKQIRGNRPVILDTSVIIDGRVVDILHTKLFQGSLVVPKFVLQELQTVADSPDKLRRARGRRGLEVLQKLQEVSFLDVTIDSTEVEGANVDQKLISLAQSVAARIMTNDFNLNKVASLRGVDVINLNDLAKALRPVVLPGESMHVKIIKAGEGPTQGVGYLEDGTMVVVENARGAIHQEVELLVTSTLQTSAGRMIFGRRSTDDTGGPDPSNHHPTGQGHSAIPVTHRQPTGHTPPPATSHTPPPPTAHTPPAAAPGNLGPTTPPPPTADPTRTPRPSTGSRPPFRRTGT